jgi:hypothetical protein
MIDWTWIRIEGESPEETGTHEGRRWGLGHKDLAGRSSELGLDIVHGYVTHTTIREGHLGDGGLRQAQRLNLWTGKGEFSVEPSVEDGVDVQCPGRAHDVDGECRLAIHVQASGHWSSVFWTRPPK